MADSKRGMVMVYVLVFLLFSQLIYWGMLRINQANSLRYSDFQDHYRANIQEHMVLNVLHYLEEDNSKLLEGYISQEIYSNYERMMGQNLGEWIEIRPNLLMHSYQADECEFVQLYVAEIFLSVELLDYCLAFEDQACSGFIQSDNTMKVFSLTQADHYNIDRESPTQIIDEVQQTISNMGYRLIDSQHYQTRLNWLSPQQLELVVGTNYGTSYYQLGSIHSTLRTVMDVRDFNRTIKTNAYDNRLIISWQAIQFEKPLGD